MPNRCVARRSLRQRATRSARRRLIYCANEVRHGMVCRRRDGILHFVCHPPANRMCLDRGLFIGSVFSRDVHHLRIICNDCATIVFGNRSMKGFDVTFVHQGQFSRCKCKQVLRDRLLIGHTSVWLSQLVKERMCHHLDCCYPFVRLVLQHAVNKMKRIASDLC